jgi:hypothetical protein
MSESKSVLDQLSDELATARDEIKLKIHLGSKDLQDEYAELEDRWNKFEAKAKLEQGASNVTEAAKLLVSELTDAFDRIRKAL